jgi:diguanylate cyclase (GGDEF)-like protein
VDVPSADARLEVLTCLGHRLPHARTREEAANEVAAALGRLDVAVSVSAIEADIALLLAMNSSANPAIGLPVDMAASLVGMRIPLDGVESLRQPVRLRRAYFGPAAAADALRRLTTDSALAKILPNALDEANVLAVPVTAGDRVVAVLSVWGPGCLPSLEPILETVSAMLAMAWFTAPHPTVQRLETHRSSASSDTELRSSIESLLVSGGIVSAVQPILRLTNDTVIGYEALARYPPLEGVGTPDQLFASAATLNMQSAVDRACMIAALRTASNIGEADLFVNVLIGTLVDQHAVAALDKAVLESHADPASIVLEFSEREPVADLALLQRIAAELRARGFRIAVDDAGAGHASMRVIAELRPEFIKLDRSLIQAIDSDRARRALVVALLSFSGHIGARVIAEGIETARERETLQSLGVQFGQGWLLGRPVLTSQLEGRTEEVVDPTWFRRRQVSSTRVGPSAINSPAPPTSPAEPVRIFSPRRGLARALSSAALALQSEHDPLRILGVMAEQMSHVVKVTEMAIYVADYETFRLVPVLATGPERDQILASSMALDAGITGWAFAKGTPQNVADTSKHPLARQIPGTAYVEESLLLIPLVATEHKLGIINCWRLGAGQFSSGELEAASLFAHVAASAWRNAQLYVELVNAAMTDPLTRLYNSRWLRDTGERDLARAARDGTPVSLLLVDLDHFKAVNDSSGHAIGDLMLQRVAMQLRSAVRGADAVVRLGGEEFVVLLHGCGTDSASSVAEAIRGALRNVAMPDGCSLDQLTASVGVATYPDHGCDLDELLGSADRAMYAAKHAGRDRSMRATQRTRDITPGDSILGQFAS